MHNYNRTRKIRPVTTLKSHIAGLALSALQSLTWSNMTWHGKK